MVQAGNVDIKPQSRSARKSDVCSGAKKDRSGPTGSVGSSESQ
jgi:hypothetical protein